MYIQRDVFINNENKSAFYKTKGSHFNQTQTMSDLCMIKLNPIRESTLAKPCTFTELSFE